MNLEIPVMLDDFSRVVQYLIDESHNTAKEKGWWSERDRNIGEQLALMHSELSEALEEWRSGADIKEIIYEKSKPCGFTIELADLLIRVFDTVGRYELPLIEALIVKMKYNKTRPYRHGNKLA
jgi:hypothetical protein